MFLSIENKGNNFWVLYLVTVLMIPVAYAIFQLPLNGMMALAVENYDDVTYQSFAEFEKNPDFSIFHMNKNIGLVLMITMFVGAWVTLWLSMKFLHHRSFKTLITPLAKINFKKILFGFGMFLFLSLSYDIVSYLLHPEAYSFHFKLSNFIPLLLVGFFILPIQTTAEELVFRGYLLQAFNLSLKAPWAAVLVTSLLFGLIHYWNPEVEKYGLFTMMTYYISAGLFLALITLFDDSLELAIGVHAAVNFYGAVVSSYTGSVIQTDSLLKSSEMNPWVSNIVLISAFIVFMIICSKKYKWPPFIELFKKLDPYQNKVIT